MDGITSAVRAGPVEHAEPGQMFGDTGRPTRPASHGTPCRTGQRAGSRTPPPSGPGSGHTGSSSHPSTADRGTPATHSSSSQSGTTSFSGVTTPASHAHICAHLTKAWNDLVAEAQLCQLLCHACHVAKGAEDRPEPKHGRYMYLYHRCRCEVCRAANAAASARQRARRLRLDEPSRVPALSPGTLDLDRSGVAQSAEQPAVNRLAGSSSLPPRAINSDFSVTGRSTSADAGRSTAPIRHTGRRDQRPAG